MNYDVRILKPALKRLEKIPSRAQIKFRYLVQDLKESGPLQTNWPNFSKLGQGKYHCHLTYRYVACWYHEKNALIVEVHYVGSREDAPY